MPVKALKNYDFDQVNIIVGPHPDGEAAGVQVDGYGGGGISFSINSDIGTMSSGTNGLPVWSKNHNQIVEVTLTLSEMAQTVRQLDALRKEQQDLVSQQPVVECPFYMKDLINGDEVSDEYARFKNQPSPSKESEAGDREFTLVLPNARDSIELASNINV